MHIFKNKKCKYNYTKNVIYPKKLFMSLLCTYLPKNIYSNGIKIVDGMLNTCNGFAFYS